MQFLFSIYDKLPDWAVGLFGLLSVCVQIYFIVDAVRKSRDIYWIWILFMLPIIGAIVYFFMFKWNGSSLEHALFRSGRDARHLDRLEAAVARIGNAANHEELGDELWRQKKYGRAEECYRAALAKDPTLRDSQVRLAYCLLEQKRPQDALPLFEKAIATDRTHDHEHLLWKSARCYVLVGRHAEARALYEEYTSRHSYAEPLVELAELCALQGDKDEAKRICEELIADVKLSPAYTRRKEGPFAGRAKRLLRSLR